MFSGQLTTPDRFSYHTGPASVTHQVLCSSVSLIDIVESSVRLSIHIGADSTWATGTFAPVAYSQSQGFGGKSMISPQLYPSSVRFCPHAVFLHSPAAGVRIVIVISMSRLGLAGGR